MSFKVGQRVKWVGYDPLPGDIGAFEIEDQNIIYTITNIDINGLEIDKLIYRYDSDGFRALTPEEEAYLDFPDKLKKLIDE